MQYKELVIQARDWKNGQFNVQVTDSPNGKTPQAIQSNFDVSSVKELLLQLEFARKKIQLDALIGFGEALCNAMMPPGIKEMYYSLLDSLTENEGLRLRLWLDHALAEFPWEYMYDTRLNGEKTMEGFLALNANISIVRDVAMPVPPKSIKASRPLTMVTGLSSPLNDQLLDVEKDKLYIEAALKDKEGINLTVVENLTEARLREHGQEADIFHFAGHGIFTKPDGMYPSAYDPTQQQGHIILENDSQFKELYPADQLGLILQRARLVVLGACETGRRDSKNVWNSVVPALAQKNIPAVIGMQYSVYDKSAIVFAQHFYRAIAAGISLDEALSKCRISMGSMDQQYAFDFGIPVLYMRAGDGVIYPELTYDDSLEEEREKVRSSVSLTIETLEGEATGIEAQRIESGHHEANLDIDKVAEGGLATGLETDELSGGSADINQRIKTVEKGGKVVGIKIGTLGRKKKK